MNSHLWYFVVNWAQTVLGLVTVFLLIWRRELRTYWPLAAMAIWQIPAYVLLSLLRQFGPGHIDVVLAYRLYFYTFYIAFAVNAICSLLLTQSVFRAAMRPLKGLQSLGSIVFTWVGLVATAISFSVAFLPGTTGKDSLIMAVSQLERFSAILTISLVAFVITAIKPLGLTVRSRVFGVTVGTLLIAITNMLQASLLMKNFSTLFDPSATIELIPCCIAQLIWIYYLAAPEPERNFVELPTTSPFHYWNEIARRLDQKPGVVAIGGFNPNAFASAEVEIFRRASAKMKPEE